VAVFKHLDRVTDFSLIIRIIACFIITLSLITDLEANIHLVRNFIFHNPTMQYFLDYLNTINSYKEHHEIAGGIVAEDGHQKPDLALLGNYYFSFAERKEKGRKEGFICCPAA